MYSNCQKHHYPTIGFYQKNNKTYHFCQKCDSINVKILNEINYYKDIIIKKLNISEEKFQQLQVIVEVIKEFLQQLIKPTEELLNNVYEQLLGWQNDQGELKQMDEQIQQEIPLTINQVTLLSDFTNYKINSVNNKIYTQCNEYFENMYQIIYKTSEGDIQSEFQKMQNELLNLKNSIFFDDSDQKNLAFYNLKLNQFINKEVQSLKNKIQEICQENSVKEDQLQSEVERNQFYYQIEFNNYYVYDISQLFNKIEDYFKEIQKEILGQNYLDTQIIEHRDAHVFENDAQLILLSEQDSKEQDFENDNQESQKSLILLSEQDSKEQIEEYEFDLENDFHY